MGCEGPHGVSPWDGHVACCPVDESADANCDNSELNRRAPVAVTSCKCGAFVINPKANDPRHGEQERGVDERVVVVFVLLEMSSDGNEEKEDWEIVEMLLMGSDK